MSDSDQDDEFEAYLKRRVPIDKGASSLEHLEPPAELDRIVIGKARKAIQGASPLHIYRAPKWALPVGLAATILLSFAILLDLGVRAKRNDESLQAARSETRAKAETEKPAAAADAPATPVVIKPVAESTELDSDRARTRLARAEKAAKRARAEPEVADPKPAEEIVVVDAHRVPANVYSSAAPVAAAPILAEPAAPAADSAAGATSVATPAPAPPPSPGQSGANTARRETLEPASWLAKIGKLRSEGHAAEADTEMKRFRETYPDYPVPKADP